MPKKNASPKARSLKTQKCIPPKSLPKAISMSCKYSTMPPVLLLDRYNSNSDHYSSNSDRYNSNSDRYSSNSDHYNSNYERYNSNKVLNRKIDRCNIPNSDRYILNSDRYSFSNSDRYFSNDNTTDEDDLDATPVQRNAANARERARMRILSKAFFRLKATLPWVPKDTKLSKLDTLRLASGYILHLKLLLSQEPPEADACPKILNVNWPFGFQSQDCMDQTLLCVQDMKLDTNRKS